jgi:hypothetical protein
VAIGAQTPDKAESAKPVDQPKQEPAEKKSRDRSGDVSEVAPKSERPKRKKKAAVKPEASKHEPKAESTAAPKPAQQAEPTAEQAAEPGPVINAEPKAKAKAKPKAKPEVESKDEPKAKPEIESKDEPKAGQATEPTPAQKPEPKPSLVISDRPAEYDDTQPELPVLKVASDGGHQEQSAKEAPAPKPKTPEHASAVDSGNGESKAPPKAASEDATKKASADEKPVGRLLPWEPAAGSSEPTDKE